MSILETNIGINIRKALFVTIGRIDALIGKKADIFILCYHAIGNDTWRYGVSKREFEKQMKYLVKNFQSVSLSDIEKHILGKRMLNRPSFVITFDDGYKDVLDIKEVCEKLNIKPCVFVLGDTKNANRKELDNQRDLLSKREIVRLKKAGWDVQSHTMTHDFLPLSNNLEMEIAQSKSKIRKDLGATAKYLAYPKGGYNSKVIRVAKKAGYTMALSMDDGKINNKTNRYAVPRIGVDRSHSFTEFKYLFSPTVSAIRGFIKTHHII